jgi:hypothetical protein
VLRQSAGPVYVLKRDIKDFFGSIDHQRLLETLRTFVDPQDYLLELLNQRIRFEYCDGTQTLHADRGVPFGCASACVLANIYLTELDRAVETLDELAYFRYADDLLVLTSDRVTAEGCSRLLEASLSSLRLQPKKSHGADLLLTGDSTFDQTFTPVRHVRHLGLLFRHGGSVALSRDKCRKVQNLFRFAFRRRRKLWTRVRDPQQRACVLAGVAAEVLANSTRNVAIIDYYLKHVDDEQQLQNLDRWLAEEVLSLIFSGHRKGHFHRISFAQLREMGLPSLVHRRRLIQSGRIESPFFVWRKNKSAGVFRGTVAKSVASFERRLSLSGPEAVAS